MAPVDEWLDTRVSDSGECAIFALDADGLVATWNAGAERIKGYRAAEILGRHFSVFYPPERIAAGYPDRDLARAAKSGMHVDQGWRVRGDGTRFWAHVVITAQRSSAGRLTGFIKVTRDDSVVHAAPERAGRLCTGLFDHAPVGIALFDASHRLLDANGSLCDLLGFRLADIIGSRDVDLLHHSDPHAASQAGEWPQGQRILRHADTTPVICDVLNKESTLDDGTKVRQVIFQDVTERALHARLLHHQATHDGLTGLRNREGVQEMLSCMDRHSPEHLTVLFCDLDDFKQVNDALGHDAGDELLQAVAQRLVDELPAQCTPARLYGDEFLVICSDVSACGGTDALTARVHELFRMVVPIRGRPVRISASIGAATIEAPGTAAHDLVRLADAAMFEAKNRHATLSAS